MKVRASAAGRGGGELVGVFFRLGSDASDPTLHGGYHHLPPPLSLVSLLPLTFITR